MITKYDECPECESEAVAAVRQNIIQRLNPFTENTYDCCLMCWWESEPYDRTEMIDETVTDLEVPE